MTSMSTTAGAALPGTYDVVGRLLARPSSGLILDAPCGEGQFSSALQRAGHRVVAGDLAYAGLKTSSVQVVAFDLNVSLPFHDDSFEAVVAIEGIEHLENPYLFLREMFRVLRPQGRLIVTTPNILNLRSRMKFSLLGSFYWFDADGYRRGGHVNPLPLYELRHILEEAGFTLQQVRVNRRTTGMRAAALVLGPFLRLMEALRGTSAWLNSTDLLCGEVLVIAAGKSSNHSHGAPQGRPGMGEGT
jgi:SAM-dependent methyltransferase